MEARVVPRMSARFKDEFEGFAPYVWIPPSTKAASTRDCSDAI